jgi:hypothetical protein
MPTYSVAERDRRWLRMGVAKLPPAQAYGELRDVPTIGADIPLTPGMTVVVQPNCVMGECMANIGGTVVVGEPEPIELNPWTAQLLRV